MASPKQVGHCPQDHAFHSGHIEAQTAVGRKTLLLAEDDDDLRLIMECTLSAMGYVVVACADAHLASAAFRANAIDVLLTDFEMPGRTGLELARELTGLQPALPVMVLTGSVLAAEIIQEIHERQWVFLRKPSNLSVVESILASLTSRHRPLAA